MSDVCPFCQVSLQEERIEHMHHSRGRYTLVQNVPATRCPRCREIFLAPDTLEELDLLAQTASGSEALQVSLVQFPARRAA